MGTGGRCKTCPYRRIRIVILKDVIKIHPKYDGSPLKKDPLGLPAGEQPVW
jgi:hypothetical protein